MNIHVCKHENKAHGKLWASGNRCPSMNTYASHVIVYAFRFKANMYERFLHLIVKFFTESHACTSKTCSAHKDAKFLVFSGNVLSTSMLISLPATTLSFQITFFN